MSMSGHPKEKSERIDLGLAILSAITPPGIRRTHREIAAYCGCHHNAIFLIEQKTLKKLHNRFRFGGDKVLKELVNAGISGNSRQPARRTL